MYAVTLSSAFYLLEKYALAVSVAAAGVIIGWPFSVLVFLPVTAASLYYGRFKQVFLSGLGTSLCTLVSHSAKITIFKFFKFQLQYCAKVPIKFVDVFLAAYFLVPL